jgi:hypothetical protein
LLSEEKLFSSEIKIFPIGLVPEQMFGHKLYSCGDLLLVGSKFRGSNEHNKLYAFQVQPYLESEFDEYRMTNSTSVVQFKKTSSDLDDLELEDFNYSISLLQSFVSTSNTQEYDGFSSSIAANNFWIAIGAPYDHDAGILAGKVYLYQKEAQV